MRQMSVLLLLASLGAAFLLVNAYKLPQTYCGKEKVYNACGTKCPLNCTHTKPAACQKICNPGCFCMEGFVELGDSCVEKEKCESCTGNTTYTTCGTACPSTCSNMSNERGKCKEICFLGCECKQGYVYLDEEKKTCVLPKDCPLDRIIGKP